MSQDMERGEKSTPSLNIGPKMERTGGSGKWEVGSGKKYLVGVGSLRPVGGSGVLLGC